LQVAFATRNEGLTMQKFAVAAAVITFGALVASAPVQAGGGQIQKDGKCFVPAQSHSRDLGFGYWGDCAQTASASVARTSAASANTHGGQAHHRSASQ
jgi:hypothetical protein